MARKADPKYVRANVDFLREAQASQGVLPLSDGLLYSVLRSGGSSLRPSLQSIVTVHYRGVLIDGTEFDSTYGGYAETFRLREVIVGWQIALQGMSVGDHWRIYIPSVLGYGDRRCGNIPGGSTLIFEVELLAVN
ncbi:MAG: FKBP-type peptidyl-prolyl cis-trans isomerase [Rikenellaceae bacterium]